MSGFRRAVEPWNGIFSAEHLGCRFDSVRMLELNVEMHLNNMQIAAEVTYFSNLRNRDTQFFLGGGRVEGGGWEKMCAILLFGDKAMLLRRYDIRVKHMLESSACSTFLCLSLMDFTAHGAGLPPPRLYGTAVSTCSIKESLPGTSVSNPRCKLDPLEDTRPASH